MRLNSRKSLCVVFIGFSFCVFPCRARSNDPNPAGKGNDPSSNLTSIAVRDEVIVSGVKRFGLVINARKWWGAGQIMKNMIDNPGFEAGLFASLIHAEAGASGTRVPQAFWDTRWNDDTGDSDGIGWPEGFWNGAEYEIVYGPAKGRAGTVTDFTHEANRNVFYLDSDGPAPEEWDAFIVRREIPGVDAGGYGLAADTSTVRPGSPGSQSLRLFHTGELWRESYHFYMDSLWRDGARDAGKLFIVRGNWRLEFWARGNRAGARLRVAFFREGEATFFDETISLTAGWQKIVRDFSVAPGTDPVGPYTPDEYHPLLGIHFYIPDAGDEAWVDDLALTRPDDANRTAFTDNFVNRLKEFRPGVLRAWDSNQLGGTLDNQLAGPWERKTVDYRPQERVAGEYGYSLHEFLELCLEVGAEPWYIIPPTLSPADLTGLVDYLAAPAGSGHPYAARRAALGQSTPWTDVFSTIHLDLGDEMWGSADTDDPFWGSTAMGGIRLGRIAHDRYGILRSSPFYDASKFNLIIGGQSGYPERQEHIDSNSTNHDTIALAPYFGILDRYGSDEEIFYPLFAQPFDNVTSGIIRQSKDFLDGVGQGTGMAVYELNFHTTSGTVPIDIRNDFVTGMGGIALPLHMLLYLKEFGVRVQCAFCMNGFATNWSMESEEYVRLFGLLRDLEATGRKRPNWLGVELVNRAVRGDMLATVQGGANPSWHQMPFNGVLNEIDVNYAQSFAFREGNHYSIILFNLSLDQSQPVSLDLPFPPVGLATRYQLAAASIHDDNEDARNVSIQTWTVADFGDGYRVTLPPHSINVITWNTQGGVLESADYNGDGTSDIAVFRGSSGLWAVRGVTRVYFGGSADTPVSGDYDGDGAADIGIFRPGSGLWAVRGVTRRYFGASSDLTVPGDYDGDGSCDIGIFRAASGLWALGGVSRRYFGASSDLAVPGDYDGDGSCDIGIFRAASGLWAAGGRLPDLLREQQRLHRPREL